MGNLSELLPSGGGQNQVEFVASGTLPNGKPVILNSNGTVTVIAGVADTIPLGSSAVFNTSANYHTGVAFDPSNVNKFVIGYRDEGNSSYGTLVVGTISSNTISFGSPVVFVSALAMFPSIAFDPNTAGKFVMSCTVGNIGKVVIGSYSGTTITVSSTTTFDSQASLNQTQIAFDPNTANRVVVAYGKSASNVGACKVGTVSGTSISFGGQSNFNTHSTYIRLSFDPNTSGKFVVVYRNNDNSNYGTASLGTVSSTSISYGTAAIFNSGSTLFTDVAFNPNTANQFVVVYRNNGNSNYGTANIGSVSGTSISYNSPTVFNAGNTNNIYIDFASNISNAFVISYADTDNSSYGTAITGSVAGTSLSFNTEAVFKSASINYSEMSTTPDGRFIVVFQDSSNSTYGTAQLGQMGSTNLTSTNLIGIAAEAASSGATAKINTWGGINEAQSSLTIASDYYVQDDGTITTATGGQKVGQAISATTINMRNQP